MTASHQERNPSIAAMLIADWKFVAMIIVLALALRLDFLIGSDFRIDADEGIVGLMAKHILEGKGIPVFYYGQDYMGSFEALLAALLFKIFGISPAALKCVPLVFSLFFVVLVYLLGCELGGHKVGRLSGVFAALAPAALVVWSSKARGGFMEVVVIGTLALLLCVRLLKNDNPLRQSTFVIGLLLGLGWWVNNQIIYYMLAIGFGMFCHFLWSRANRLASFCQHVAIGLIGFVLGGLPFWIYNFERDFVSFKLFGSSGGGDILRHVTDLFSTALPIMLGARRDWGTADLYPFSSVLVCALYGFLLLFLLYQRRVEVLRVFLLRVDSRSPLELLLLFLFAVCAVFSISSFGSLAKSPRYILPAYSGIFVLSAYAICRIGQSRPSLGRLLAGLILFVNLASCYVGGRGLPGEPFVFEGERVAKDHSSLVDWLKLHNFPYVRTNYWIGYRLAFETQEQVKFVVFGEPAQARIEDYEEEGARFGIERMPLVLVPAQSGLVQEALQVLGYKFRRTRVGGYDVIYDLEPGQKDLRQISPKWLSGHANYKPEHQGFAVDGQLETRWGSAHPQVSGMQYVIELDRSRKLRALRYELGEWRHDYPRDLEIELESPQGQRRLLLSPLQYRGVLYYGRAGAEMTFLFEPEEVKRIVLRQTGSHPVLDWSIAEISLFE